MTSLEKKWMLFFLALGIALRLALYFATPPNNFYDDHFEPILYTMCDSELPDKNECWECNQPPVFYVVSAIAGKVVVSAGANAGLLFKLLQLIPVVYGIMTLPVIYLILLRFPLPVLARILTFGTVCLLPQHIYICVLHSNDTMSYLFMALSVLVFLIAIEKKFAPKWLIIWSAVLSITIFTKYTALAILPMSLVGCLLVLWFTDKNKRLALINKFVYVFLVPVVLLAWYSTTNIQNYGKALPDNTELLNVKLDHAPGMGKINYFDFKPWTLITSPVITPDNIGSFWTLIYGHMWFDIEPKFILFTEKNHPYWESYYYYLRYKKPYPGDPSFSTLTNITSRGLLVLGLIPLSLICLGIAYCIIKWKEVIVKGKSPLAVKVIPLFILFCVNAAGIVLWVMKYPFFSHMKGIFFLGSLPFFAVFLSYGMLLIDQFRYLRNAVIVLLGGLFIFVVIHIVHIIVSIH